ncbi:MAG: hypothetical protein ACI3Y5_06090 [Prevotella sp.]
MKRYLLIILSIISTVSYAQKVQVSEELDSIGIVMGDQCHLFLSVTARAGSDVRFPDFSQQKQMTAGIEVVEQMRGDSILNEDGTIRQTVIYTITSFEPKLHYIAPLPVIVEGRKYYGKKLALKVLDVPVDTTKLDQFFPPKGIQTNPFSWSEWLPSIMLYAAASLLAVLAVLLYLMRKGNKPIRISFRIIRRVPAHIKAMTAIEDIKETKLDINGDQKEYYTRLTDTLRIYLKERFGFSAMEMTTSEIIQRLKDENPTKVAELRELFETADLVKFAKYSTLINENDRNLVCAIDFINSTKTEETVVEQREEEQLTEQQRQMKTTRRVLKWAVRVAAVLATLLLGLSLYSISTLIE